MMCAKFKCLLRSKTERRKQKQRIILKSAENRAKLRRYIDESNIHVNNFCLVFNACNLLFLPLFAYSFPFLSLFLSILLFLVVQHTGCTARMRNLDSTLYVHWYMCMHAHIDM